MKRKAKGGKSNRQKTKLGHPDLEHAKLQQFSIAYDLQNRNVATAAQ